MTFPEDSEFLCVSDWSETLYQKALLWAQGKKRAVFISDEMRKSSNPNVKIYHLESPLQEQAILKKIAWDAVFQKMHIVGDQSVKTLQLAAELILSEASDFWVRAFRNARANHTAYRRGADLKGAFQGVPAVIVGAGPSLAQHGHLLKELKRGALIFAGGAALNSMDVEPDFAASIDAIQPLRENPYPKAPFCYQPRMNSENFSLIEGEKILFADSCPGINWIYREEMFNGGWTVGNFLTAVAVHFGCSPIIFIGMDFCYEKGVKYAKLPNERGENLIEVDGFLTQRDFLMAAKWTEEFGKEREFFKIGEGLLNLPKIEKPLFPKRAKTTWSAPLKKEARWDEWDASMAACKKNLEFMQCEVVYQMLLEPLWQIWRPVFEREVELDPNQNMKHHQMAFFQRVLEEHV